MANIFMMLFMGCAKAVLNRSVIFRVRIRLGKGHRAETASDTAFLCNGPYKWGSEGGKVRATMVIISRIASTSKDKTQGSLPQAY